MTAAWTVSRTGRTGRSAMMRPPGMTALGLVLRACVLSLLLLLAQRAALLHELSHLAEAAQRDRQTQQDAHPGHPGDLCGPCGSCGSCDACDPGDACDSACTLCLAFAQLHAGGAPSAPARLLLEALQHVWEATVSVAWCKAAPPALHNRDPPRGL